MDMPSKAKGAETLFIVRCSGPCINVNVFLNVSSGDPDLYVSENSTPVIKSSECINCNESLCAALSDDMEFIESCENITTVEDNFHVLVYAYESYENGTIKYENGALEMVERYGK